jgi:hypothetical protein
MYLPAWGIEVAVVRIDPWGQRDDAAHTVVAGGQDRSLSTERMSGQADRYPGRQLCPDLLQGPADVGDRYVRGVQPRTEGSSRHTARRLSPVRAMRCAVGIMRTTDSWVGSPACCGRGRRAAPRPLLLENAEPAWHESCGDLHASPIARDLRSDLRLR